MLILHSTVFYAQWESDHVNKDSIVFLTIPEVKYFIIQDTKEHYFEKDNKDLLKKDFINTQIINNNIVQILIKDSVITELGEQVRKGDNIINDSKDHIIKQNQKLKTKDKIIFGGVIAILIETIILILK